MHLTHATSPHHIQLIHLCIDRNIQVSEIYIYNLKLDYIYILLHSPLSFRIDVRLEDSFYSYGYRLVIT